MCMATQMPVAAQAEVDAHHRRRHARPAASPARTSSSPSSRKIGAAGAIGHVIEYAGSAIRGLSMEGRLTLCNMSIEAGGRAGMVAPDETTFDYLKGRPFAPKGENWDKAMAFWRTVPTDDGATFDTRGARSTPPRSPDGDLGHQPRGRAADQRPRARSRFRARRRRKQESMKRALDYMDLEPGTPMDRDRRRPRLHRLLHQQPHRGSARGGRGRQGPQGRRSRPGWSPGSGLVKEQAEAEGLDKIFRDAGFDWREPGCSMCIGINGDIGAPASASPRPPTATSSAARARACAPTSSARRWPPPPPSPATSPTCASCWARSTHHGRLHHPRPPSPCRSTRPTSTPTRSSRRAFSASCGRPRSTASSTTAGSTPTARPREGVTLNNPAYKDAKIIVANYNFACGSSRENAVTVMVDNGFRAVHRPALRRHLLQQLLPERLPADPPAGRARGAHPGHPARVAGRGDRDRSSDADGGRARTARTTASTSIPSARRCC